jgi:hypothetical protein
VESSIDDKSRPLPTPKSKFNIEIQKSNRKISTSESIPSVTISHQDNQSTPRDGSMTTSVPPSPRSGQSPRGDKSFNEKFSDKGFSEKISPRTPGGSPRIMNPISPISLPSPNSEISQQISRPNTPSPRHSRTNSIEIQMINTNTNTQRRRVLPRRPSIGEDNFHDHEDNLYSSLPIPADKKELVTRRKSNSLGVNMIDERGRFEVRGRRDSKAEDKEMSMSMSESKMSESSSKDVSPRPIISNSSDSVENFQRKISGRKLPTPVPNPKRHVVPLLYDSDSNIIANTVVSNNIAHSDDEEDKRTSSSDIYSSDDVSSELV